ncbi:Vps54-like protein-domain-containing protein [Calycina marina]|uniref:Vacuolar protein sorting-associated protein 54 n=1 Tax=Calycina marina TaxID=1763456 RepID=A0A9P7Z1Z4_9HELO|nr:Vps54-like protein-domain-containing protein [Calycina marina]
MTSPAQRQSSDSLMSSTSPPLRNEYPFPRPGSSGKYASRRGSTASSIHSIGGTLDTAAHANRLTESSQNAISTLLQSPIVRTGLIAHTPAPASSAHKPPTSRDIPPVSLSHLKPVDPAEFRPYLTQVGVLYDALQRAKDNEEDGGTQLSRRGPRSQDFADLIESDRRSEKPSLSRQASLASLASSLDTPSLPRRKSSNARRTVHQATPLNTIPNVYFEENFHLENPRTFDVVSERSEVVRPAPGTPDAKGANGNAAAPRRALATNAILQEKLSWYMDTIEVHLISSISTASTSFFAALGSLKDLHSEAAESVSRIKELRKELESLDQEMAVGGLNIVNKRRRKENLKQLSDAVQQLKIIVQSFGSCEALVDNGDVIEALDAIESVGRLIAGEEPDSEPIGIQLRDLRGAVALQRVNNDLDTLRLRIGKTFETRFLNALIGDLRHHIEHVSAEETLKRWSASLDRSRGHNRDQSAYPTYLSVSKEFRGDILAVLSGLHRARHTSPATTAYREAVLRELRSIIRRTLPASNEDDASSMMSSSTVGGDQQKTPQEKSSLLAQNLRALDPEDAEELLRKMYIGIGESLRRLGTQVKVLLDVTTAIGDPAGGMLSPRLSGMMSPPLGASLTSPNMVMVDGRLMGSRPRDDSGLEIQEQLHQTLDMSNLLGQAVDIAQDRIVKILKVRSEQSTHLTVDRFLRYFNLNLLFANECEAVSGRSGTSLKNVVNGHIKDFVKHMYEAERQSLATGMEADLWNTKDFTDEDNEYMTRILSASTQDAQTWMTSCKIWLPSTSQSSLPAFENTNGSLAPPSAQDSGRSTPSTSKTTKAAMIDSEPFILPLSATLCLRGLSSFLHLITGIPSMTTEIATNIISYLTLFNSRCTQLILGAGATRSAGLKNITTKHLALASQALSFISSLITHVREFVRRHVNANVSSSVLMADFDKIRRSFLEHQQSIYDKLLDIMSGRAATHSKALKAVSWDLARDSPNAYIEQLSKDTSIFHKVMIKHLPEATSQAVMQPIYKAYREQLGKAYGDVVLGSEDAKKRMLRDVEYFKTRIGGLDGATETADYFVKVVQDKPVPRPVAPTPEVNGTTDSISAA